MNCGSASAGSSPDSRRARRIRQGSRRSARPGVRFPGTEAAAVRAAERYVGADRARRRAGAGGWDEAGGAGARGFVGGGWIEVSAELRVDPGGDHPDPPRRRAEDLDQFRSRELRHGDHQAGARSVPRQGHEELPQLVNGHVRRVDDLVGQIQLVERLIPELALRLGRQDPFAGTGQRWRDNVCGQSFGRSGCRRRSRQSPGSADRVPRAPHRADRPARAAWVCRYCERGPMRMRGQRIRGRRRPARRSRRRFHGGGSRHRGGSRKGARVPRPPSRRCRPTSERTASCQRHVPERHLVCQYFGD